MPASNASVRADDVEFASADASDESKPPKSGLGLTPPRFAEQQAGTSKLLVLFLTNGPSMGERVLISSNRQTPHQPFGRSPRMCP